MTGFVVPVFLAIFLFWAALAAAAAIVCTSGARRQQRLRNALAWLGDVPAAVDPLDLRPGLDGLLGGIPLPFLVAQIADGSIPDAPSKTLCAWLVRHSRTRLLGYASSTAPYVTRRRLDALRILVRAGEEVLPLLERALADPDPQVVGTAVSLLGAVSDRRAAIALIGALRTGRYQPSRIATVLDRFPLPISDLLRPLATDKNSTARFWGATLLSRYAGTGGVAEDVAMLVRDRDPQVRKAAIQTLAATGNANVATLALGLLGDPVWYVRAHAARALGELGRVDLATQVMPLLADRQWWVRQAAKESLVRMGPRVWRDVIKGLDHPDQFARNGAAEVLQNLGVLDSMIVLEATTDHPAPDKVEMLRKIAAAGGVRMTTALLERTDARLAQRIRALLDTIGLQAAGV